MTATQRSPKRVSRSQQTGASAGCMIVCLMLSVPAVAQAPDARDEAAGVTLFHDGRRLMAEERYAEACPKFEGAERIRPGVGTKLNLALCYEKLGRTASAWGMFRAAAAAARAIHDERESLALQEARRLEEALPHLTLTVQQVASGMRLLRNGSPIDQATWGTRIPVDPGATTIEAQAPGRKTYSVRLELQPGDNEVSIPPLEAQVLGQTPAPPPNTTSPANVGVWAAGAVGLVGIGVGSVFGLLSLSSHNEADKKCRLGPQNDACDSEGQQAREDAITRGNVSTASFVIGGVGLAAGAVLWLTTPKSDTPTQTRLGVGPVADLGGGWMQVRGVW